MVCRDNGFSNGESKSMTACFSCARRIGTIETIKDFREIFSCNDCACVLDGQFINRRTSFERDVNGATI